MSHETEEVIYRFLTILKEPDYDYLNQHVEIAHNTNINAKKNAERSILRSDSQANVGRIKGRGELDDIDTFNYVITAPAPEFPDNSRKSR